VVVEKEYLVVPRVAWERILSWTKSDLWKKILCWVESDLWKE